MRCAIWYHLHNSKNVKNTHGGVLLLVKLQANCTNSTKSRNAPQIHPVDKYKTVLETEMNQRAKINQILRADNHLIVNNPKL